MPFSPQVRRLFFLFAKEQGVLPAITGVLHTFGSDLKRHVHIHFIVSAGGLKLSGKAERFTRYIRRKAKDRRVKKRAKKKKVAVLLDEPSWIHWSFFPHKVLRKRYQSLLIKHLKERIQKELRSDMPDKDLMVFPEPSAMKGFFDDLKKEYKDGFFVHITEERKELKPTIGYIGRYARRPPSIF